MDHQEELAGIEAASRSGDQHSIYWADVESRARQRGVPPAAVVASDKAAALSMALISDECLIPDQAEALVGKVEIRGAKVEVHSNVTLSADEKAAVAHIANCAFCRSMVACMEPVVADRERFLEAMRKEMRDERQMRHGVRIAYLPSLLLLSMWGSVVVSLFWTPTVTAASLLYYSPFLLAGIVLSILIAFAIKHSGPHGLLVGLKNSRANRAGGIFLTAIPVVAALLVTVIAGLNLRSEVRSSQWAAASSLSPAILALSKSGQDPNADLSIDAASVSKLAGSNFVQVSHNSLSLRQANVPGRITTSIGGDTAKVSWDILGRNIETLDLKVLGREDARQLAEGATNRMSPEDLEKLSTARRAVVAEDIRHQHSAVLAAEQK